LHRTKPIIAYVSESDVNDRHAWSGTVHYLYKALVESGYDVRPIGPDSPRVLRLALAALNKISLLTMRLRFDYRHSAVYSKALGARYSQKLAHMHCDAVLVCGSTESGAYIRTDKPVIYVLDRTIQGALNYHEILSNLWSSSMRQSIDTDRRAMRAAALLLFSSQWAADHAKVHYHIETSKLRVIPFGANLDEIPARETALAEKDMSVCRLLLIGTSWKNKGVDYACTAAERLNSKGIRCELTVVGCTPPDGMNIPGYLHVIPFADKNTREGRRLLDRLYLSHHFFILPTRFDCTPIVFCEASAYGLPVMSADTGGVAGHVKEGVNGYLLPYSDTGEAYADKIGGIFRSPDLFNKLRVSTRDHFERHLNWRSWAENFEREFSAIASAAGT
jgi:glycosyltransferase involved in cell wall biosynthesis